MNRSEARKKPPMKPGVGAASINMNVSRKSSHSFGSRSIRTIGGGSRNNLFNSSSRKSVAIESSRAEKTQIKPPVQVFDDMGQDVTPRSLLQIDPTVKRNQSNTFFTGGESIATPSVASEMTGQSFYAASSASMYGGFSRSVFGSVSGRSSPESVSEDLAEPSSGYRDKFAASLGDIQTRPTLVREELTEADLDKMVHLSLCETETIWLLDFPGTCVAEDSEIADGIKEKNQRYDELLKNRVGNDSYVERGMQTFNNGQKNKEIQSIKVELHEVGCVATTWDMYDTYNSQEDSHEGGEKEDGEDHLESLSRPVSGERTSSHDDSESVGSGAVRPSSAASGRSFTGSRASMFTFKSSSVEEETPEKPEDGITDKEMEDLASILADKILQSENMQKDLFTMERAIALNIYQSRQARYRGLDIVTDIDAEKSEGEEVTSATVTLAQLGPNLHKLWSYSCNLTKGRNVSCLAWNKLNPDILAVGYGEFVFSEQKGGLACCWSIKNPEYPERVFHLNSGVTAVDFSAAHANLLAVGMYDGTIAIYNVRNRNDGPALDSFESQGKHSSPVWQVRWVDREQGAGEERDEILISISADGRVTKWSIRKGFECTDLMKLKRINVAKQSKEGGKKSDALISRFAAGFCFDVHPNDSNMYVAGTEEGHIHKCSCSYNEQYLESYHGHTGPVYRLQWSPFLSDAFLSCSADWSIRLWHQDKSQPVLTFLSSTKSVNDVCWSPSSATLFACVNDKAVEVWDLSLNTLDPIISHVPVQELKLSCVRFTTNSEIQTILVGDSEGQVTVYQLRGLASPTDNQAQVLTKLIRSVDNSAGSPGKKKADQE
ncbi:WD repeat-containing protein 78 [Porites harrisoni]